MAVFDARSMQDIYINRAVKTPTVIAEIVSTLGVMGLTLAVVGLYGLAAYSVNRRTREIGVRMALGANPLSVTKMVLKQGLALGLAGVAVGLLIGFSRAELSLPVRFSTSAMSACFPLQPSRCF